MKEGMQTCVFLLPIYFLLPVLSRSAWLKRPLIVPITHSWSMLPRQWQAKSLNTYPTVNLEEETLLFLFNFFLNVPLPCSANDIFLIRKKQHPPWWNCETWTQAFDFFFFYLYVCFSSKWNNVGFNTFKIKFRFIAHWEWHSLTFSHFSPKFTETYEQNWLYCFRKLIFTSSNYYLIIQLFMYSMHL